MQRTTAVSLFVLLLAHTSLVSAQAPPNGTYRLEGEDPDGNSYRGSVVVHLGHEVTVERQLAEQTLTARGNLSPDPSGRWTFTLDSGVESADERVGISSLGAFASRSTQSTTTSSERRLEVTKLSEGVFKAQVWADGQAIARERWVLAPNDVIYFAMSDYGRYEAKSMREGGASVIDITDSDEMIGDDRVEWRGNVYVLLQEQGIRDLLRDAGAPEATWDAATAAILQKGSLSQATADSRDELGKLATLLAEAEVGDRVIERLVFSGHSSGASLWGDKNGRVSFVTLHALFAAFPKASAQVEDVYFSSCYSGNETVLGKFRATFPNLKTFWAYKTSAPGTWTGAKIHASRWEAASRGSDPSRMTRSLAAGTRKGENVVTWSLTNGFMHAGKFRALDELKRELQGQTPTYNEFFSGLRVVESTQQGPLRDYYGVIHEMLGMPTIAPELRSELEAKRDQCIRLIFYDAAIRYRFVAERNELVERGFRALGLEAPNFAELSRADTLRAIEAFEQRFRESSQPADAARLMPHLIDGLRDLRESHVPDPWI